MPGIWNINNGYNTINKKVSSKLTFETGQKFSGRISSKGASGEVTIKLSDGWQFTAKIEGDYDKGEGISQFQVTGFEDGNLQLKIIKGNIEGEVSFDDSLDDIIKKEGLSKEDSSLLKSMVKHNIPLTRENIVFIKGILQFNDNIKNNTAEVGKFIDSFIQGKGIEVNSEEGQNIKNTLMSFFDKYNTMSKEDILLFLENNIDINGENIDSYNKLFKSNNSLNLSIKDIADKLSTINIKKEEVLEESFKDIQDLTNKDIEDKLINNKNNISNGSIASKLYLSNDTAKGKVSMLSVLKSMTGTEESLAKTYLKEILSNHSNEFTTSQYRNINNEIESLSQEKLVSLIGKTMDGPNVQENLAQKVITNIFNKELNINEEESLKLNEYIKFITSENKEDSIVTINHGQKNINIDCQKIKDELNSILQNRRRELSQLEFATSKVNIKGLTNEEIKETIGQNLTRFGNVSKEGFSNIVSKLFGKDINIIDDEFRQLKNIYTITNIKEISEPKASSKDVLLQILNSQGNEFTKSEMEQAVKVINELPEEKISTLIKENLDNLGNKDEFKKIIADLSKGSPEVNKSVSPEVNKSVSPEVNKSLNEVKEQLIDLNRKNSILNQVKGSIDELKEAIKEIIPKTDIKGAMLERVSEYIKANINDFKLFNSISNEYYYLALPIKQNNKEYPCKLIIKDNRKDGKKIDKTNVKMVVSVKTVNIGDIDSYISVRNNNLDIKIKCDKKYVKLINSSKDKLKDQLDEIGFISYVKVDQREEEVNLVNCREFFNDKNSRKIDRKV